MDHPRSLLGGLNEAIKFRVDRFTSLGDIRLGRFFDFGWKLPNHAHFLEVLGGFDPLHIMRYDRHPEKALMVMNTRLMSHFV